MGGGRKKAKMVPCLESHFPLKTRTRHPYRGRRADPKFGQGRVYGCFFLAPPETGFRLHHRRGQDILDRQRTEAQLLALSNSLHAFLGRGAASGTSGCCAVLVGALWIHGQGATRFVNEVWGRRDILSAVLLPNLAGQTCALPEFVCLVSYRSRDLILPVESLGKCIYWSLDEMGLKHVRQRPHPRQWLLYICVSRSGDTRSSSAFMAEGGRGSEQGAFPLLA